MARDNPLRRMLSSAGERTARTARSLSERLTRRFNPSDEGAEAIDFSSPSVPYYADLAARFDLSRLILWMVLFVFVVVTLISGRKMITYDNLYYLIKDIRASSLSAEAGAELMNYPVSDGTPDFAVYRGGLVIAGSDEITVLGAAGRETLTEASACSAPRVAASDKYFLTYGQGECGFAVWNPFARVLAENTEYPVYAAAVADDGSFCVVTRSRDYRSEVLLYGSDFKLTADCHVQGYVTDVCLNAGGTACGFVSVAEEDGSLVTTITVIREGDRVTRGTVTLHDPGAAVCGFIADDRLAVVTGSRLLILRTDGDILSETEFGDETPRLAAVTTGRAAVLTEKASDLSGRTLRVYDRNGRPVYVTGVSADSAPSRMVFSGNVLYVLAQNRLLRVSADGRSVTSAPVSRDTLTLLPDGDGVLVCGTAYARRMRAADFAEPEG